MKTRMDGGLLAALAFGVLATGAVAAGVWSLAAAAPEHGAHVGTGIVCGTPAGDCVVPAQPVGSTCACSLAGRDPTTGMVLPPTATARGG